MTHLGGRRMDRRQFLKHGCWWAAGMAGLAMSPAGWVWAEGRRPPPPTAGRIALIVDDIGFSVRQAECFLRLRLPLTFSILPRLPYSAHLAQAIGDQGHDVMLHQPMYGSQLRHGSNLRAGNGHTAL